MARYMKGLGFVLLLALAIGAIATLTASAGEEGEHEFTAPESTEVVGEEVEGEEEEPTGLTAYGELIACNSTYRAYKPFNGKVLTLAPEHKECSTAKRAATITRNECNYVFHFGKTLGEHEWEFPVDVSCPGENLFEYHVYVDKSGHTTSWCTLTIGPQAKLSGPVLKWNTTTEHYEITGSFSPQATPHGTCSFGGFTTPITVKRHLKISLKGLNEEEEEVPLTVD